MLYGSGSWVMTAAGEQRLCTTQRKMLRSILGKGRQKLDKDSSEESLDSDLEELEADEKLESWVNWILRVTREAVDAMKKVGVRDWPEEQRRRLWRWAGHAVRRTDGRWTRKVIMWTPRGQRRPGRPIKHWEDAITKHAIQHFGHARWYEVARDREVWHKCEKAFVT